MEKLKKYSKFVMLMIVTAMIMVIFAAVANAEDGVNAVETVVDNSTSMKAIAAAITVGLAAAVGAISMGVAISKAVEGISRQPEAEGKIRTALMLGLVFIETAIIYALIVAVLIIFVL